MRLIIRVTLVAICFSPLPFAGGLVIAQPAPASGAAAAPKCAAPAAPNAPQLAALKNALTPEQQSDVAFLVQVSAALSTPADRAQWVVDRLREYCPASKPTADLKDYLAARKWLDALQSEISANAASLLGEDGVVAVSDCIAAHALAHKAANTTREPELKLGNWTLGGQPLATGATIALPAPYQIAATAEGPRELRGARALVEVSIAPKGDAAKAESVSKYFTPGPVAFEPITPAETAAEYLLTVRWTISAADAADAWPLKTVEGELTATLKPPAATLPPPPPPQTGWAKDLSDALKAPTDAARIESLLALRIRARGKAAAEKPAEEALQWIDWYLGRRAEAPAGFPDAPKQPLLTKPAAPSIGSDAVKLLQELQTYKATRIGATAGLELAPNIPSGRVRLQNNTAALYGVFVELLNQPGGAIGGVVLHKKANEVYQAESFASIAELKRKLGTVTGTVVVGVDEGIEQKTLNELKTLPGATSFIFVPALAALNFDSAWKKTIDNVRLSFFLVDPDTYQGFTDGRLTAVRFGVAPSIVEYTVGKP